MTLSTSSMANEQTVGQELVFGEVTTVRPVPSRGVTQIVIEIPSEAHIKATQLLFGRNAFIFAGEGVDLPFGVAVLKDGHYQSATAPKRTQSTATDDSLDITKWLGIRCKDADFQRFLQTDSYETTVDRVRDICQVDSRSDIQHIPEAKSRFLSQIYQPFNRYCREKHTSWRH